MDLLHDFVMLKSNILHGEPSTAKLSLWQGTPNASQALTETNPMTKFFRMGLSLFVALSLTALAPAAEKTKSPFAPPTKKQLLKLFDKNRDGKLSIKERSVARIYVAKLREQRALNRNAAALSE